MSGPITTHPDAAEIGSAAARAGLARLCLMGSLAYCSYAMCRTPLLPLLARELGATAPLVGIVVAASTITGIFLKLPAGAWSDVLGRRPLLVAGALVFAALPFTYLGVASLGLLVALRAVHGSATALFGPVASASLSDVAPPDRRATWLSTYATVQGAGQAVGPVVAGYLLGAGRYDLVFVVAGTVALSTPLLAAGWALPPAVPRLVDATARRSASVARAVRGVSAVARHPRILVTSLAQAAQFVLHGTLNAFLPLFALDELGLTPSHLGWLFGLQTVTTLATRPVMGVVSDAIGRRTLVVTGLVTCGGAVLVVSAASGMSALLAGALTYAIGVAITTAATSAYITDLAERRHYGAAHGVFGTIYDVGDALGPLAAGVLVASLGYARMFQVMAALTLVMAAFFFVATRARPEPSPDRSGLP